LSALLEHREILGEGEPSNALNPAIYLGTESTEPSAHEYLNVVRIRIRIFAFDLEIVAVVRGDPHVRLP
jgi:hypothetical protein